MEDYRKEIFDQLSAYANSLGEPINLNDEDAASYWRNSIENKALDFDTFYSVFDYRIPGFTYLRGIKSALGLKEGFSINTYFNLIHPDFLQLYTLWGIEALEMAIRNKEQLEPFKFTYRISIPLLHENKDYYHCFQNSTILQLDAQNQLVSQINTFRMGIRFSESDIRNLKGEIFSKDHPASEWNQRFMDNMSKRILKYFTTTEQKILKAYIEDPESKEKIAEKFQVTLPTLYTHNRNILKKASRIFHKGFGSILDFAHYLNDRGYLPN
ncbi:MAG: hypothetical protein AAF694_08040 [Bacteroidota bacterium]